MNETEHSSPAVISLPADPTLSAEAIDRNPALAAAEHPESPLAWALLSVDARMHGHPLQAYAFARTGFHNGLTALQAAGWRGHGAVPADSVPWRHVPNRGFLLATHALSTAAAALGQSHEAEEAAALLDEVDPSASREIDAMLAAKVNPPTENIIIVGSD